MSRIRRVGRRAGVVSATLLLGVLVLWLGARLWALQWVRTAVPEFEARYGSLDPAQWHRKVSQADNAGRNFEAAALLFEPREPEFPLWRKSKDGTGTNEVTERERIAFDRIVALNQLPLEIWMEATKKSDCVLREALYQPLEKFDPYFSMGYISDVQTALALREFESGATDTAADRVRANLMATACLQAEPAYMHHLLGNALERRLMPRIRGLLEAGALDESLGKVSAAITAMKPRSTREYLRIEAATFQPEAWWRRFGSISDEGNVWYHPFEVRGFAAAAAVRGAGRVIESLDDPAPPAPPDSPIWPWKFDSYYGGAVGESFWRNARMAEAQQAVRTLALRAFELRREALESDRYPISSGEIGDPTPLTGERIRVESLPNGSVELSLPRSAARWTELQPLFESRPSFDWTWTLPPLPGAGAAKGPGP